VVGAFQRMMFVRMYRLIRETILSRRAFSVWGSLSEGVHMRWQSHVSVITCKGGATNLKVGDIALSKD